MDLINVESHTVIFHLYDPCVIGLFSAQSHCAPRFAAFMDAVADGIFDKGLNAQREYKKIGFLYLVFDVELLPQSHFLDICIGTDIFELF